MKISDTRQNDFSYFKNKMTEEGIHEVMIKIFEHNFNKLVNGDNGTISSKDIQRPENIVKYENIKTYKSLGIKNLDKIAIIRLNGGLGTSMGLDKAKSLLIAKNQMNFIEISYMQIEKLRHKYKCKTPILYMNSFNTDKDTKDVLSTIRSENPSELNISFTENKVPKISINIKPDGTKEYRPAKWEINQHNEWCPPGHADIYPALVETSLLNQLIELGYEYLFISNIDNLAATVDPIIVGYLIEKQTPFLMEVAERTEADKKGGHLATKDGALILRESAQCLKEDTDDFQNITKYNYFNTNNIWINLKQLKTLLTSTNNVLDLPIIVNEKNLDPTDNNSPKVIQLETAMGSAIQCFENAQALQVPRSRFLPIKKTSDLLLLRSDNYILNDEYNLILQNIFGSPTIISLSDNYKFIKDFEERFKVYPSLKECKKFEVTNDTVFDKEAKFEGEVKI